MIEALIPLIFLIGLLGLNVLIFGDEGMAYPNQIALLLAAGVAGLLSRKNGVSYTDMLEGAVDNIMQATPAIFVLLLIGSLAGSWLISGIIPAMIYYGLQLLSPEWFLVSSCVLCAVVSIATGSSWGTIATIGIALLGIGRAMGFHEGLIAGAVISGAYFGDKMSPLSDTTNLAPAVAGTDLITHIKYMTVTTVPSIIITLMIFTGIGLFQAPSESMSGLDGILLELDQIFNITPVLFLVPALVIGLILLRIPAAPSLAIGALAGIVMSFLLQGELLVQVAGGSSWMDFYKMAMQALGSDMAIAADAEILQDLLSTGGMAGMLGTIWLILCAMIFGGIMERNGSLAVITEGLLKLATGRTSLIGTTAMSSMVMNFTASDQYLAIVVPGKMFAKAYKDKGLHAANLSRTLEDAGTVTSVLVPWNTCGATQAKVLGVATGVYWPYCFFCLISPLMTLLVSAIGYKIKTLTEPTKAS